mmetsp:Transcript_54737/g.163640  ORF Transcript_54737/g.163640 Transcript_54737/m.163640 type:complete len:222 (+) Transcript_54737:1622-2287(+)
MIGIPRCGVRPILHPSPDEVYDVVHGARLVRGGGLALGGGRESAGVAGISRGDLGLSDVVGGGEFEVRRGAPFVGHRLHSRMEGNAQLKHMLPEYLIDRPPRYSLHAQAPILQIVRKIPIGIDLILRPVLPLVPQRVRRGDDDDPTGRYQPREPPSAVVVDPAIAQIRAAIQRHPHFEGRILRLRRATGERFARRRIQEEGRDFRHGGRTDPLVSVEGAAQ